MSLSRNGFRRLLTISFIVVIDALMLSLPIASVGLKGFLGVIAACVFLGAPLGGFWMLYHSIRDERRPGNYIALACIPYSFVWYYLERFRGRGSESPQPVVTRLRAARKRFKGPASNDLEDLTHGESGNSETGAVDVFMRAVPLSLGIAVAVLVLGEFGLGIILLPILAISSLGSLWMLYHCIRYENRPLPFFLLAFAPFGFVWYYYARVRRAPNERN